MIKALIFSRQGFNVLSTQCSWGHILSFTSAMLSFSVKIFHSTIEIGPYSLYRKVIAAFKLNKKIVRSRYSFPRKKKRCFVFRKPSRRLEKPPFCIWRCVYAQRAYDAKSCAVGMRNAILRNHLNPHPSIHSKNDFYNDCPISRALIGSFLSSIRVQTDKILIYASFPVQLSAVELSTFNQWDLIDFFKIANQKARRAIDTFASFWIKFTCLCLRQVYGVFSLSYSRHLTILRLVVPKPLWQCYDAIYHH